MSYTAADFGFVGGSYEAPMSLQDAQKLINWFVEVDASPEAKMPVALLGAPGLQPILSTIPGEVRGAWVLPGNLSCLFVVGPTVWMAQVTAPASSTNIPTFSITQVGTLLTANGRVVIRDNGVLFNGAGGYAVLVDGQYGYYYTIAGGRSITFTGNTTSTSNLITFPPGTLVPSYLLASSTAIITDTGTALSPGTYITLVDYSGNTIQLSQQASGNTSGNTFTLTIPQFGQITDSAFLGASRIAFIEGWLIFNQPGTRTFYTNAPIPYTLTFAGAFYALKDSSTDNLVTLYENNRELWLIGERTSEVWYNSGGANFAFSRLPGIGPQVGCSAQHSITRCGPHLVWLAQNEQGENYVVRTQQYDIVGISNHAIDNTLATYPQIGDAIGDCYQDLGHTMYVLTFPTQDVTWCVDLTTHLITEGKLGWWQRLSFDPSKGVYHRHIGNCYVNFANVRMWGDYQSGQIHMQSRNVYTDNGKPLRALRRTPHIWTPQNRERLFHASLQIEFTPGVGLATGQGSDPQVMVRWSDDGGFTWGNENFVSIGKEGETRNRAMVYQCGEARDRVWEAVFTDPTPRDIIGATLFGEAEI